MFVCMYVLCMCICLTAIIIFVACSSDGIHVNINVFLCVYQMVIRLVMAVSVRGMVIPTDCSSMRG
jgi:hypothetical protein